MKVAWTITAALTFTLAAQADFSYRMTRKTGGAMGAMANQGQGISTFYFKGQKMKSDNGNTSTILDFDAQTITTVNNSAKSYTVRSFADVTPSNGADVDARIDLKETGRQKTVNGFATREFVMTMEADSPLASQTGKLRVEMELWVSREVPGGGQLREFYQRNADKLPWAAMSNGGNASMQHAMADAQRKMASIDGVPVEQIVRLKNPLGAGAAMPQVSGAQADQMAQARARLEALIAQGGPQAAALKQALARLPGGATTGSGAGSDAMVEITMDASDFSTAAIPDSVFAIPAGYQKGN